MIFVDENSAEVRPSLVPSYRIRYVRASSTNRSPINWPPKRIPSTLFVFAKIRRNARTKGSDIFKISSVGVCSRDIPSAASASYTKPYASEDFAASRRGDARTNRQSSYSEEQSHSATLICNAELSRASTSLDPIAKSDVTSVVLSKPKLHFFDHRLHPACPVPLSSQISRNGCAPTIVVQNPNCSEKRHCGPPLRVAPVPD